jgi:hypothetical protein
MTHQVCSPLPASIQTPVKLHIALASARDCCLFSFPACKKRKDSRIICYCSFAHKLRQNVVWYLVKQNLSSICSTLLPSTSTPRLYCHHTPASRHSIADNGVHSPWPTPGQTQLLCTFRRLARSKTPVVKLTANAEQKSIR